VVGDGHQLKLSVDLNVDPLHGFSSEGPQDGKSTPAVLFIPLVYRIEEDEARAA
jgi:hypothetical protein